MDDSDACGTALYKVFQKLWWVAIQGMDRMYHEELRQVGRLVTRLPQCW